MVGTVKEVVHQISHSKKWKSEPMRDENRKQMYNENGKPMYFASYSLLQDQFFEHMQEAGFTEFQRGERGSTADNLSCLDYKVKKDKEHLVEIGAKIEEAEKRFEDIQPVVMELNEVEQVGKKSLTGKIQMSSEEYGKLTELAKEGITSRETISQLKSFNKSLGNRVRQFETELFNLEEKCKPYLEALQRFPDKVKAFFSELLKPKDKPKEDKPWEVPMRSHKPKKKEDFER